MGERVDFFLTLQSLISASCTVADFELSHHFNGLNIKCNFSAAKSDRWFSLLPSLRSQKKKPVNTNKYVLQLHLINSVSVKVSSFWFLTLFVFACQTQFILIMFGNKTSSTVTELVFEMVVSYSYTPGYEGKSRYTADANPLVMTS